MSESVLNLPITH